MFRFLLATLAALALAALFMLVETVKGPLARLVRAMLLGLTALLTILGLAIGASAIANEAWWAAVVSGGILLVALRLGWALRKRRPADLQRSQVQVPVTRLVPDSRWRKFEGQLDWVSRKQARDARSAIDRFIAESGSPSLTPEHQSLLLSCQKRVPELIDACLDRCRNASEPERERYIDETLARLGQIGAEANRARIEIRSADDRKLQVLHRYFDTVTGPDEKRPADRP